MTDTMTTNATQPQQEKTAGPVSRKVFVNLAVSDLKRSMVALSCESRAEVDQMVRTALANGGSPAMDPQDHGFMFERSFEDPDGHIWEVFWMDPKAMPQA